jgi:hypothetical protein
MRGVLDWKPLPISPEKITAAQVRGFLLIMLYNKVGKRKMASRVTHGSPG